MGYVVDSLCTFSMISKEFLQKCLHIYERQISAAQSPREAVYIPSEMSPRQQKKPSQPSADHPPPDGVDTRYFLDAVAKECQRAKFRLVTILITIGNFPIYNRAPIDRFTDVFKLYACLFNKGCSWQPESLPEVCPSNACNLDSKYCKYCICKLQINGIACRAWDQNSVMHLH